MAKRDHFHISTFQEDGNTYGTPTWISSVVVDGARIAESTTRTGAKHDTVRDANERHTRALSDGASDARGSMSDAGRYSNERVAEIVQCGLCVTNL